MLRTLDTKIAPFLNRKFDTFEELLIQVQRMETGFAKRSQIQQINPKWLAGMLPQMEAALQAATISPYEDAKEKLSRLDRLVFKRHGNGCCLEIHLNHPPGVLTHEELTQAFQIFEMSAVGDTLEIGGTEDREWITQIRSNARFVELPSCWVLFRAYLILYLLILLF